MPYDSRQYIEKYVQFRFYNNGSLVTLPAGIGTDMIFDNKDIKGDIVETLKNNLTRFDTGEGFSLGSNTPAPKTWQFTININEPVTFEKLRQIDESFVFGYTVEAKILAGYQSYDGAGGMTGHVPGLAIINPAVIYCDRLALRQIARGKGTRRASTFDFTITEGINPVVSGLNTGSGGAGGGGA